MAHKDDPTDHNQWPQSTEPWPADFTHSIPDIMFLFTSVALKVLDLEPAAKTWEWIIMEDRMEWLPPDKYFDHDASIFAECVQMFCVHSILNSALTINNIMQCSAVQYCQMDSEIKYTATKCTLALLLHLHSSIFPMSFVQLT